MIKVSPYGRGSDYAWVYDCLLHDLRGHSLVILCGNFPCDQVGMWSFAVLSDSYDKRVSLGQILKRLRCSQCGVRPQQVVLRERMQGRDNSSPKGWALRLVPELEVLKEYKEPYLPLPEGKDGKSP